MMLSGYISLIADARTGNCDVWISSYDSAGGTAWYVVFTYTESISGAAATTLGDDALRVYLAHCRRSHGQL